MNWWQRLIRRGEMEDQLDKELRFHVQQHTTELIASGLDPAEARRQARLALGGPEQVKELCRDARGTRWLEDFWYDTRYALRTLRQRPGFSVVALLTLALGIGATTLIFTLVNGVLLAPLPFPDPTNLFAVHGQSDSWNVQAFGQQNVARPDFLDLNRESRSLALAGWLYSGGTVSSPGMPEYVDLREVSPQLFSVLGVTPFSGRFFLSDDDRPGSAPVAILGYSFWQRRFAANPTVLGSALVLDSKSYTVVGIAPPTFRLYQEEPDLLTPLGQNTARFLQRREAHPINVVGRLQAGFTSEQAQQEFAVVARQLAAQFPETNAGRTFTVQPLRPDVGDAKSTLWLLFGAVALVLLIACANIASLLLARAVSRERELAMRVALGATRGRLVRQCLTESFILAWIGGSLGLALASLGFQPFIALWPGALPRADQVQVDVRVLLFALGVSLLSGLLFGIAPALRAPFRDIENKLRQGARSIGGGARRLHGVFIVSEVAIAIVLLVAAGILGRAILRLSSLDPGLNTSNVLVARMAVSPAVMNDPPRIRVAWQDLLDRARRLPSVQSAALVDTVPMREGNNLMYYWPSADLPPEKDRPLALATSATPGYLDVMGIPLRQGRFFDDHDRLDSQLVVVIDEVLARNVFHNQNPIGKYLWIPDLGDKPTRVVGVVGHVRHWGLASDDQAQVRAQLYYPFAQVPDTYLRRWSELLSGVFRTSAPPLSLVEALRGEIKGASGDQVLYAVHTMDQLTRDTLARQRFLLLLFGVFSALALLLACIGIYGVLAYITGRRIPEMGLRMALGADSRDLRKLILRESFSVVFIGVALGAAGALVLNRILVRTVEGTRSVEFSTFVVVLSVLTGAALLASWLPAERASRVDPVIALRQE
jgi:predicted permease